MKKFIVSILTILFLITFLLVLTGCNSLSESDFEKMLLNMGNIHSVDMSMTVSISENGKLLEELNMEMIVIEESDDVQLYMSEPSVKNNQSAPNDIIKTYYTDKMMFKYNNNSLTTKKDFFFFDESKFIEEFAKTFKTEEMNTGEITAADNIFLDFSDIDLKFKVKNLRDNKVQIKFNLNKNQISDIFDDILGDFNDIPFEYIEMIIVADKNTLLFHRMEFNIGFKIAKQTKPNPLNPYEYEKPKTTEYNNYEIKIKMVFNKYNEDVVIDYPDEMINYLADRRELFEVLDNMDNTTSYKSIQTVDYKTYNENFSYSNEIKYLFMDDYLYYMGDDDKVNIKLISELKDEIINKIDLTNINYSLEKGALENDKTRFTLSISSNYKNIYNFPAFNKFNDAMSSYDSKLTIIVDNNTKLADNMTLKASKHGDFLEFRYDYYKINEITPADFPIDILNFNKDVYFDFKLTMEAMENINTLRTTTNIRAEESVNYSVILKANNLTTNPQAVSSFTFDGIDYDFFLKDDKLYSVLDDQLVAVDFFHNNLIDYALLSHFDLEYGFIYEYTADNTAFKLTNPNEKFAEDFPFKYFGINNSDINVIDIIINYNKSNAFPKNVVMNLLINEVLYEIKIVYNSINSNISIDVPDYTDYKITFDSRSNCNIDSLKVAYSQILSSLPTPTPRDNYVFNGWYYNDTLIETPLKFLYEEDIHLTARWQGNVGGFTFDEINNEIILTSYTGIDTDIIIPDTFGGVAITTIRENVFLGNSAITSVKLGKYVSTIDDNAFRDCINLVNIEMSSNTINIGTGVFYGCTLLETMILSSELSCELSYLFGNDIDFVPDSLIKIKHANGSTFISNTMWMADNNGVTLELADDITIIEYGLFQNSTHLISIIIPSNITTIKNSAFRKASNLTSVTFGDNSKLTSIETSAFSDCSSLTTITFPDSVTTIGNTAFSGCRSLTTITIPEGITSIGNSAFYNTAWYNNQIEGLVYLGKVAYKYKGSMLNNTSITLLSDTKVIADYAFRDCITLTTITIPNSVTHIGSGALQGCISLTIITIPKSVTHIGSNAFQGCVSLTTITIPDSKTPPILSSPQFNSNSELKIYVPSESVEIYKSTSGWSIYASRIYPIE